VTSVVEVTNEVGETETSVTEIPIETEMSGYRNVLILGVDARDMNFEVTDGINADVIMIASINNDTGEVKLVSILRDTIMRHEDGGRKTYAKANEQIYAGISDMVSMINRNLGLDIDEYMLVNWYGVAVCINQMEGVTVNIPNYEMIPYFNSYLDKTNQATGIWAPEIYEPGTYNMSGTQAVAYCRIRYLGINDTGRAEHQREVISQLVNKAKDWAKAGRLSDLIGVAQTGLSNVRTNLTLPDIMILLTKLSDFNMAGTEQFPKEYTTGHYLGHYPGKYDVVDPIVANDFQQEVRDLHKFLFNEDYEPSDFIKNISYQMYLDRTGQ